MTTVAFRVFGEPVAQGSMKCVGQRGRIKHVIVDSKQKQLEIWRARIAAAATMAVARYGVLEGPVIVGGTITVPRPASVPLKKRAWPITRSAGDLDKHVRAILDGLVQGGLLGDDSQVVHPPFWKCYPDTPGCPDRLDRPGAYIRIETLT